jgi:hypothetical protein
MPPKWKVIDDTMLNNKNSQTMKKSNLTISALLTLASLAFFACGSGPKTPKESQTNSSQMEKIHPVTVFENDYAKVLKVHLNPGEELEAHDGKKRVIYSLTDYSIDWTEQGVNKGIISWKSGDVHFHEEGNHAAKNTGASVAEWLVFLKKSDELPDCSENALKNDVNAVAPNFSKLLFENNDFKVTQVTLPQRKIIPTHAGVNRIIFSLSDYQIIYESDKSEKSKKQFKKGDAHWHEDCNHSVENIGETEAIFLVIAYKVSK